MSPSLRPSRQQQPVVAETLEYSPAAEAFLRAMVLDHTEPDESRLWAIGVLQAWGVILDPEFYPFVPRTASAKGACA